MRCKEIVHGREKIGIIPTMGLFILFAVVALVFSTNFFFFYFFYFFFSGGMAVAD